MSPANKPTGTTAPKPPPADAIALATLAGTMLMVLRLGRTSRELARAQLEILRRLPPRLLGAILNDVREESEYRAYAYYMDGYQVSGEPPFQPLVAARGEAETEVAG